MPRAARFRAGGLVSVVITILAVLLPPLVCGASIDAPVHLDEVERLQVAINDPGGEHSGPASLFYGLFLPETLGDDLSTHVQRARFATVFGVFGISGLLFLAVAFARTRGTAALACVAFAASPTVSVSTLRPEIPVTLFGMLGVVLLLSMPIQLAQRRRRSAFGNGLIVASFAFAISIAFGLALASNARYGILLLVPGGAALLAIILAGMRFGELLRRRGVALEPFLGFTRRVAPWCLTAFASLVAGFGLVSLGVSAEVATRTGAELLPEPWLQAVPLAGCAAFGALVWMLGLGLRLGRVRRVQPDAVLLVFCAVMMMQRAQFGPIGADALPAAPAFALLVSIGLRVLVVWTIGRIALRAVAATQSTN